MCVASSIFDSARTKRQSCRPPNTQDSGNEDLVFRNLLLAESTIVHSHYAPFGAHLTLIQSQQLSALRPLLAEHTKQIGRASCRGGVEIAVGAGGGVDERIEMEGDQRIR